MTNGQQPLTPGNNKPPVSCTSFVAVDGTKPNDFNAEMCRVFQRIGVANIIAVHWPTPTKCDIFYSGTPVEFGGEQ